MRGRLHWTAALRRYLTLAMPRARPWGRNRPAQVRLAGRDHLAKEHDQGGRPRWKARVDGHSSFEIMRRVQTSKPTLWHWQQRYLGERVVGLTWGNTQPSRVPLLPREIGLRVKVWLDRHPRFRLSFTPTGVFGGGQQFHYARTLALDSSTAPLSDASDVEGLTLGPQQASASSSVRPRSFWLEWMATVDSHDGRPGSTTTVASRTRGGHRPQSRRSGAGSSAILVRGSRALSGTRHGH